MTTALRRLKSWLIAAGLATGILRLEVKFIDRTDESEG